MVLDAQTVDVQVLSDERTVVAGPGQVNFGQQVCATEGDQQQDAAYTILVPRGSNATAVGFLATASPRYGGPASSGGEASVAFTLSVLQPVLEPRSQPVVEKASPSPAGALVLVGLVALAALVRRRAA
jgi:MYXO-CTERM domain-containing protein